MAAAWTPPSRVPNNGRVNHTRVLLLHGIEHHRPSGHWLWLLAESLRRERIPVQYPQLPSPGSPSLDEWMDVARAELAMLGDGDRVVITHSLGGLLWCRLAPTLTPEQRPSRVLVTAPPTREVLDEAITPWAAPTGIRLDSIAPTLIVGRDTDDYRHSSIPDVAAAWGGDYAVVPGHGHLTPADGYGKWEAPLEWIRSGDASVFER